jgi:hypothetical protein
MRGSGERPHPDTLVERVTDRQRFGRGDQPLK